MSIRINKEFIRGMRFTRRKPYKEFKAYSNKNSVELAWIATGKQLDKALEKYEKMTNATKKIKMIKLKVK